MSGLACYDFGDTIRFAACTAGYLSETADILTEKEIETAGWGSCHNPGAGEGAVGALQGYAKTYGGDAGKR